MKLRLTDDEFGQLRRLLDSVAGLVFDDSRREALAFCVSERMRSIGYTDVSSYLSLLAQSGGEEERQALLDEVTIPETHFFRNPPQITALRRFVLPQLIKDAAQRDRKLRIWSAGCSTGEEPYTVAMLIRELLPLTNGWDISVVATDISRRGLAMGRAGHYLERSLVMTEPDDVNRFFIRDVDSGTYVVRPEVRELVEFRRHNLVTEPVPFAPGEIDLILCRNVTIYFDRDTTRALVGRLHDALRDGGYLFLGHAETLWQISDAFHLVTLGDAFVYRRDDDADATSAERRNVIPDRRSTGRAERWGIERRTGKERRHPDTSAQRAPGGQGVLAAIGRVLTAPINVPPLTKTPEPTEAAAPAEAGVEPTAAAGQSAESAASLLAETKRALSEGHYAKAVDLAARIVVVDPMAAEAHYLRGLALSNLGRDAEALVDLRKAVYLDPASGFAHFLLAGALSRVGETVAAARSYRAAADTLSAMSEDVVAAELDGRSPAELARLCVQLAERAERNQESA